MAVVWNVSLASIINSISLPSLNTTSLSSNLLSDSVALALVLVESSPDNNSELASDGAIVHDTRAPLLLISDPDRANLPSR